MKKIFVLEIEELIKGYIAYKENIDISKVNIINYANDNDNNILHIIRGEYYVKD